MSIHTKVGMAISTLVLAGTVGKTQASPEKQVKKHSLLVIPGRTSRNHWLLHSLVLSKTLGWLPKNLWAMVLAVGGLLIFAVAVGTTA